MTKTSARFALILIWTFLTATQALAQVQPIPAESKILAGTRKLQLDESFPKINARARKDRELLSGLMMGLGGAFLIGGAAALGVGNDHSTAVAPPIYAITGAIVTLAGFAVSSVTSVYEDAYEEYASDEGSFTVEEMQSRAREGTQSMIALGKRARTERFVDTALLALAAASQFYNSSITDPGQQRDFFVRSGAALGFLGLAETTLEKRTGGAAFVFLLGAANTVAFAVDPSSPSKDFLLYGSSMAAALSIFTFFNQHPAETEGKLMEKVSVALGPSATGPLLQICYHF
jgi:hypothetical protein